jgi:hypothetical protein
MLFLMLLLFFQPSCFFFKALLAACGGQKSFGMFAYSPQNIGDVKKIRETIIFRKALQDSH